jgi:hypothetical protein
MRNACSRAPRCVAGVKDGLHGRGGFDLALGRGRARVRAGGGRGSRGGLWVRRDDAHGVTEEHARAAQELFATRSGAPHACLCRVREVHACLGVPDAVRDRVAEAGEQV